MSDEPTPAPATGSEIGKGWAPAWTPVLKRNRTIAEGAKKPVATEVATMEEPEAKLDDALLKARLLASARTKRRGSGKKD